MKKLKSLIAMLVIFTLAITMNTTAAFAKSNSTLKITTNKSTLYLLDSANNRAQLKVTYGGKSVTKSAQYSTSNKKIATVNKNGTITAKGTGTVKVNIKYKKSVRSITMKVKKAKLSLSKKSLTLTAGEKAKITVYANKSGINNKSVKWTSDDSSIASVNSSGVITAKKAGTTKITCTTSIGKVTCTVTVKAKEKKEDVPDGDSDNGGECTTHNFVTTKEPVTKTQIKCMGCGQYFDSLDDIAIHAYTSPVNDYCGATAGMTREVVITPGEETCTICGETRQLYNVGDVISQ